MVHASYQAPEASFSWHLPRVLCLHGGGTNARIFRAQCRALEKSLGPFLRLVYVQAPFRSKPGPDVVSVYSGWSPFRAWLDPGQDAECITKDVLTAIRRAMAADNANGATGRFVGLLGFSQGAKICASLLRAQETREGCIGSANLLPIWRFAILLAGRGPFVSAAPLFSTTDAADPYHGSRVPALASPLQGDPTARGLLKSPTLHVHGFKDPNLSQHRRFLYDAFDQAHVRLVEWDGDHRVPIRTKDVAAITLEVVSMARKAGIIVDEGSLGATCAWPF